MKIANHSGCSINREDINCKKELEESLREHPALRTLVAWTLPVLMLLVEDTFPL
jgi:hypothetical protein